MSPVLVLEWVGVLVFAGLGVVFVVVAVVVALQTLFSGDRKGGDATHNDDGERKDRSWLN